MTIAKKYHPTVNIEHDTRRQKKDGTYPCKLKVSFRGRTKRYGMNLDLFPDDFDAMMGERPRGEHKRRRQFVDRVLSRAKTVVDGMTAFVFEEFERRFFADTSIDQASSLQGVFIEAVSEANLQGRTKTAGYYQTALNVLKEFKANVDFNDVTVDFLRAYEAFLKGKGCSLNTVSVYMRALRSMFNRAGITGEQYPFGRGKYQIRSKPGRKKALSARQLATLYKYWQGAEGTEAERLDYWFFSYLCNGINPVDIARLTWGNVDFETGFVLFARKKTETTLAEVVDIKCPILPEAKAIIERRSTGGREGADYVFPILEQGLTPKEEQTRIELFIRRINDTLERICKNIDLPKTTIGMARHCFATQLKHQGTPVAFIGEALGHTSAKTTELYLKSFEDKTLIENAGKLLSFLDDDTE